jgi:hypothetical protein
MPAFGSEAIALFFASQAMLLFFCYARLAAHGGKTKQGLLASLHA